MRVNAIRVRVHFHRHCCGQGRLKLVPPLRKRVTPHLWLNGAISIEDFRASKILALKAILPTDMFYILLLRSQTFQVKICKYSRNVCGWARRKSTLSCCASSIEAGRCCVWQSCPSTWKTLSCRSLPVSADFAVMFCCMLSTGPAIDDGFLQAMRIPIQQLSTLAVQSQDSHQSAMPGQKG